MKKTVVLGASPNPARYSFKGVKSLIKHGHEAIPVGFRPGVIYEKFIQRGTPEIADVHTVSLYIGPQRQIEFYDYILSLNPERVIFNPGTINHELMDILKQKNVEVIEGCMLVMLSSGDF